MHLMLAVDRRFEVVRQFVIGQVLIAE